MDERKITEKQFSLPCLLLTLSAFCVMVITTVLADPNDLRAHLKRVSDAIVDLTTDAALLGNKEFLDLHNHPDPDSVLQIIADPSVAEQEKIIAVYSVQSLPLPKLLGFLGACTELRKSNSISSTVWQTALFPGYLWNTQLDEHYREPAVRHFLEKLQRSSLPDAGQRKLLQDMLDGQAYDNLNRFRKEQRRLEGIKKWGGKGSKKGSGDNYVATNLTLERACLREAPMRCSYLPDVSTHGPPTSSAGRQRWGRV